MLNNNGFKSRLCFTLFLSIIIFSIITGCSKKKGPSLLSPDLVSTATVTKTPEPATATFTFTAAATATITATVNLPYVIADPPSPILNAYNVQVESMGNTLFVGYQSGDGVSRQLNIKSYTAYSGWTDHDMNIAVTHDNSNQWFSMGFMAQYVVAADSAGYLYVYYSVYNGFWQGLGVNPIAGPGCAEASIASNYQSTFYEDIYVMYIDTADSNKIKGKRMDNVSGTIYSWQDVGVYPGGHRAYKVNPTGSFSIASNLAYTSRNYYLAFPDLDSSSYISTRFINGTDTSFVYYGAGTITAATNASYISTDWGAFAFSDPNMGGRARVFTSSEVPAGPASSGQASLISFDYSSDPLLAYADMSNGGALAVKRGYNSWTTIPFPPDPITSCSVGIAGWNYKPYVAYTTDAADGRRLKLRIQN